MRRLAVVFLEPVSQLREVEVPGGLVRHVDWSILASEQLFHSRYAMGTNLARLRLDYLALRQ